MEDNLAEIKDKMREIDKGWASYTGWQREYFIHEAYNFIQDAPAVACLFGRGTLPIEFEDEYWREELHYLRGMWLEDRIHQLSIYWLNKMKEVDEKGKPVVQFHDRIIKSLKALSELKVSRAAERPVKRAKGGTMSDVHAERDKLVEIGKDDSGKAA